jgi:hypothetical protein
MDPVFDMWKCFWPTKAKPEPRTPALSEPPPEPAGWREATLRRLEAWIEEREQLIVDIDRRISEALADSDSGQPTALVNKLLAETGGVSPSALPSECVLPPVPAP